MKPGFYWIIIKADWEGPEIAALRGDMFFTTRSSGDGETIAVTNDPQWVEVLAGPIPEPAE